MHSVTFLEASQHSVGQRTPAVPVLKQFSYSVYYQRHRWKPKKAQMIAYVLDYSLYLVGFRVRETRRHVNKYKYYNTNIKSKCAAQAISCVELIIILQYSQNSLRFQIVRWNQQYKQYPQRQKFDKSQLSMKHNVLNQEGHQDQTETEDKKATEEYVDEGQLSPKKQQPMQSNSIHRNENEARDFFADHSHKKQRLQGLITRKQGSMFKRTFSFELEDEPQQSNVADNQQINQQRQQIISENSIVGASPSVEIAVNLQQQPQPVNKYDKHLRSAFQYLNFLRFSYYLSLFRFLFIAFVYYNVQFTIPQPMPSSSTTAKQTEPDCSPVQPGSKDKLYEPWNVMVYFLSGSIDLIAIIGYISSMRALKYDIKLLEQRRTNEQQRLNRQRNGLPENPPLPARHLRIGKDRVYTSLFSTLRNYRYKNRDQAAPYKISKIMHLTATYLFFGRMALVEQYLFEQALGEVYYIKELVLWIFLLTAYLANFQVDYFGLETSNGVWVRLQKFSRAKLHAVYDKFVNWRIKYTLLLKLSLLFVTGCICCDITVSLMMSEPVFSAVIFFKFPLIVATLVIIKMQMQTVYNSRQYMQYLKNQRQTTLFSLSQQLEHKNLSMLGILHKQSPKGYGIATLAWRVSLFLFGVSVLRVSDSSGEQMIPYFANVGLFVSMLVIELWKFKVIMTEKINFFDSFKFNSRMSEQDSSLPQVSTQNKQKPSSDKKQAIISKQASIIASCSVCLQEYSQQQNVVIICCGHNFHENCLMDWFKQKKECPLCRCNLEQYFEEVSF